MDLHHHRRPVTIRQLPDSLNPQQVRAILRDLDHSMDAPRPSIVLDCSRLRQLDRSAIHLLISSLEEAMKRNGDVRLAAVPHDAMAALKLTGSDRLFEIYATTADAINSFQRFPHNASAQAEPPENSHRNSENAA